MNIKNNNKGFMAQGVIVIIALLGIAGGAYYIGKNKNVTPQNNNIVTQTDTNQNTETQTNRIIVLNPKGGEVYKVGEKVNITWNDKSASDVDNFTIVLTDPKSMGNLMIANEISIRSSGIDGTSSYMWTIPNLDTNSKYKIEVYRATARELLGRSKEFSIVSKTTSNNSCEIGTHWSEMVGGCVLDQPSVTVLSPNGGETWKLSSVQNIRWDFGNGSEVAIFLRPHPFSSSNRAYLITKKVANNGSYSWKVLDTESAPGVPATKIPSGNYTLSICVLNTSFCDVSDSYLSITN